MSPHLSVLHLAQARAPLFSLQRRKIDCLVEKFLVENWVEHIHVYPLFRCLGIQNRNVKFWVTLASYECYNLSFNPVSGLKLLYSWK